MIGLELKPCPFCGEKVRVKADKFKTSDKIFLSVVCDDCLLQFGCAERGYGNMEQELYQAWNSRYEELVPTEAEHNTALIQENAFLKGELTGLCIAIDKMEWLQFFS